MVRGLKASPSVDGGFSSLEGGSNLEVDLNVNFHCSMHEVHNALHEMKLLTSRANNTIMTSVLILLTFDVIKKMLLTRLAMLHSAQKLHPKMKRVLFPTILQLKRYCTVIKHCVIPNPFFLPMYVIDNY